jgi:hypothetical protein
MSGKSGQLAGAPFRGSRGHADEPLHPARDAPLCAADLLKRVQSGLVVVVDVRLADVLVLEVLVRRVRVMQRRMIVLMLVRRAEVLEPSGHLVVVVGHVEVPVAVHHSLVVMLFPPGRGRVLRHDCSFRLGGTLSPDSHYPTGHG